MPHISISEADKLQQSLLEFQAEIGGKLIYVHVLSVLPENGILGTGFVSKALFVRGNSLFGDGGYSTIHFSLNRAVDLEGFSHCL